MQQNLECLSEKPEPKDWETDSNPIHEKHYVNLPKLSTNPQTLAICLYYQ